MAYLAKSTVLHAYKLLSNIDSEKQQGLTQKVSALKYASALDLYFKNNGYNCDLKNPLNKDKFASYVGDIVKINNSYCTKDFYLSISPNGRDFDCGSNFYSQSSVKDSKTDPSKTFLYPKRSGWKPVMDIQDQVLIYRYDYLNDCFSFYLGVSELRLAFIIWILRFKQISEDNLNGLRNTLNTVFTSDYCNALYTKDVNNADTSYVEFDKNVCALTDNDINSLFANSSNSPKEETNTMDFNRQQIFYGAPGTGKSFKIKECTKGDDTVIRTTFHPDSDYSTFVGCYKPTMINKEPVCTVGELINKLSAIKNSSVTYPCDKFAERYWESLKNLSPNEINSILTACGCTTTTNVEIKRGIAVGEYFAKEQENKKIAYAFVPQAFTKAYIQAWEKMANYNPIDKTFSVGSTKYDIIGISGDIVRVKVSNIEDSEEIKIEKSELEDIFKTKDSHNDEEQKPQHLSQNKSQEPGQNIPENRVPDPNDKDKVKEGLGDRLRDIGDSFDEAWDILKKSFLKPQFLIIEEINRGNCAQIFGDLFQLLDRGNNGYSEYPIDTDDDLRKELKQEFSGLKLDDSIKQSINNIFKENYPNGIADKILNGELLVLPKNLYIWATMNTSDQSLFPIDSAFKRRWEWKYIPIKNHEDKGYSIDINSDINGVKYDWWGFLARINQVIGETTSSEDKKLGYFFAKAKGKTIDAEQFVGKVLFYIWNDVFKNYGFDNQIFSKGDKKKFEFSDFFKNDGTVNDDAVNMFLRKLEETIKIEDLPLEIKEEGVSEVPEK